MSKKVGRRAGRRRIRPSLKRLSLGAGPRVPLRNALARLASRLPWRQPRPTIEEQNLWNLYVDTAWFGVLNGIAATFHALLQIAQIEAGTPRSRFQPVDLAALCQTFFDIYEPSATEAGQRMTLSLPDASCTVRGDRNLLGQLLANARPVQSRVDAVRGDIERLRELVAETRLQLTEGNESRTSLAAIGGQLRVAEAEMATRQEMLAASAAQMESARIEANKQVRYLSLSVSPVAPDEATYPKAFQNTIVAFLIFSGIYLMMSLTASILREQVST